MTSKIRICLLMISLLSWYVNGSSDTYETVHTSNAAILNRLGLVPLEIPEGHHKKRVAGPEPVNLQTRIHQPYSRRHGHRDSHVYVVKLPASPPYYTVTKPHKSMNNDDKISTRNSGGVAGNGGVVSSSAVHQPSSVGFHTNGKPAKIYHWNLPLVKKISEKKRLHAQFRMDQMKKRLEAQEANWRRPIPLVNSKNEMNKIEPGQSPMKHFNSNNALTYTEKFIGLKQTRNNDKLLNYPENVEESRRINSILDGAKLLNGTRKMYRLDSTLYRLEPHPNNRLAGWTLSNDLDSTKNVVVQKAKKHRKKAAMSYYAPIMSKTGSTSINKNFPGNGKPKAFYVMEKSRKPVYYHPLLP